MNLFPGNKKAKQSQHVTLTSHMRNSCPGNSTPEPAFPFPGLSHVWRRAKDSEHETANPLNVNLIKIFNFYISLI